MRSCYLLTLPLALLVASCVTTTTQTVPPPVAAPVPEPIKLGEEGSKPIAFARFIFNVKEGTTIGAFYNSYGGVIDEFDAPDLSVGSERFGLMAREELLKAEYSVMGGENMIFGQDESAKARFQLGAQMSGMKLNVYQRPFQPNLMNSSTTIEWQVYDTYSKQVIYSQTTTGDYSSAPFDDDFIYITYRNALRALLANEEFAQLMRKNTPLPSASKGNTEEWEAITLKRPSEAPVYELPKDVDRLLDSVVQIKVGNVTGSGFVVSSDGYIMTAGHVVAGTETVQVMFRSGLELEGKVERVEENIDVGLVRIPGSGHTPLVISSAEPTLGTDIYVIGNPSALTETLNFSVARGILSAKRDLDGKTYLQTDASVNPGNSGGPVLNQEGQVVGIVSWKVFFPGFEGLGFAVPTDKAMETLKVAQ